MRNMRKLWLTIASVCVVVGCSIFAVTMTACSWDFKALSTQKNITNTYEISEDFNNISIDTDTADIVFVCSSDGQCKVVCQEFEKEKHSVAVENGTLTIKAVNERRWYDYIGINIGKVELTVYLPKTQYQALAIKEDTGDIEINGFAFDAIDMELTTGDVDLTDVTCTGALKIDVTTGDVELERVTCKSLSMIADTGDLSMESVLASESISIETDTGDVEFEGCDAPQIVIKTDTGDVEGSLLTGKEFITETDTGKVRVPQNSAGGRCEVATETGDIKITIGG